MAFHIQESLGTNILIIAGIILSFCATGSALPRKFYDIFDDSLTTEASTAVPKSGLTSYSKVYDHPYEYNRLKPTRKYKQFDDNTRYYHGLTYEDHKRLSGSHASASFSHPSYSDSFRPRKYPYRFSTTSTLAPETPSLAGHDSYFNTSPRPTWRTRIPSTPKPTVRTESHVRGYGSNFIVTTGLKAQNICCQNETSTESPVTNSVERLRNRFRHYGTFSKDRGYIPDRAIKYITSTSTTTTTRRPSTTYIPKYHGTASRYGLTSGEPIVGIDDLLDIDDDKYTWRHSRTTYTPFRSPSFSTSGSSSGLKPGYHYQEHTTETRFNDSMKRPARTDTFTSIYSPRIPKRFDPISPPAFSKTKVSGLSGKKEDDDEYDYYEENDIDSKRNSNALKSARDKIYSYSYVDSQGNKITKPTRYEGRAKINEVKMSKLDEDWNRHMKEIIASTTPRPKYFNPYKKTYGRHRSYDEDDDFIRWKADIERTVENMRKPSGKFRIGSSRANYKLAQDHEAERPIISLEGDEISSYKVDGGREENWTYAHERNEMEKAVSEDFKEWKSKWRLNERPVENDISLSPNGGRINYGSPEKYRTTTREPVRIILPTRPRVMRIYKLRPTRPTQPPRIYGVNAHYRHRYFLPKEDINHTSEKRISASTNTTEGTRARDPETVSYGNTVMAGRGSTLDSSVRTGISERSTDTVTASTIPTTSTESVMYTTSERPRMRSKITRITEPTTAFTTAPSTTTIAPSTQTTEASSTESTPSTKIESDRRQNRLNYWRTRTQIKPRIPYARMSFAEQLALSHKREMEAKQRQEEMKRQLEEAEKLEKMKKTYDIEGSGMGSDLDRMISDQGVPDVAVSVPEVADLDIGLEEVEEEVRELMREEVKADGTVFGELMDEHIIKVHDSQDRKAHRTQKNSWDLDNLYKMK